jgi:hypothetical protein
LLPVFESENQFQSVNQIFFIFFNKEFKALNLIKYANMIIEIMTIHQTYFRHQDESLYINNYFQTILLLVET